MVVTDLFLGQPVRGVCTKRSHAQRHDIFEHPSYIVGQYYNECITFICEVDLLS